MRPTTCVPLVALAGAAVLAAPAAAAPYVVAEQDGIVRQVVRQAAWVAWTRCAGPQGPTEVWARRLGSGELLPVPALAAEGPCEATMLHGVSGTRVIATVRPAGGWARLTSVDVSSGDERVLARASAGPEPEEIAAADASGPLVAWIRRTAVGGPATGHVRVDVLTHDIRAATAPTVVWSGREGRGPVPTGVWRAGDGSLLLLMRSAGPAPTYDATYGTAEQTLVHRRTDGAERVVSRVRLPVRIADADVDREFAVWALVRDDSTTGWVYERDLSSGERRLLAARRGGVRPGVRDAADPPVVAISGTRAAWRVRERVGRGFVDRVWGEQLRFGNRRVLGAIPDVRTQRVFQGAPSVWGQFAQWPVVRFDGPAGWRGGWAGLSARGARSQVVIAAIR